MNGIINANELTIVKKYEFENPLIQNIDSIINKCYRDCHYKYFHTFNYECNMILILKISLITKLLI